MNHAGEYLKFYCPATARTLGKAHLVTAMGASAGLARFKTSTIRRGLIRCSWRQSSADLALPKAIGTPRRESTRAYGIQVTVHVGVPPQVFNVSGIGRATKSLQLSLPEIPVSVNVKLPPAEV